MSRVVPVDLDHFYTFGEVHETLEAVDQVERMLSRLKRQNLLSDQAWLESEANLAQIRGRVEGRLQSEPR